MDDNKVMFYPSYEWMDEKYDEFNKKFFDGRLPWCKLAFLESGKGSQGGWLGSFSFGSNKILVDKASRRMSAWIRGVYTKLDETNIVEVTPIISLNIHYKATEEAWENVLVHEMCHYWTYFQGYAPKQAHGREFRNAAQRVQTKSLGKFTIQRLATSEEMTNFDLDDDMKAKKEKRLNNKKAKVLPLLVYLYDGSVRLINVGSWTLAQKIVNIENNRNIATKIILVKDPKFIDMAFADGYNAVSRGYKYWLLNNDNPLLKDIDRMNTETLWQKMNEELIKSAIMETISEFLEREFKTSPTDNADDSVEILPNMNLGIESPFERDY